MFSSNSNIYLIAICCSLFCFFDVKSATSNRSLKMNSVRKLSSLAIAVLRTQDFVCGLANNGDGASSSSYLTGLSPIYGIIGGSVTSRNEFPWLTYLLITKSSGVKSACGGSIIDSNWVLTAAHCFDGAVKATIYLGAQDTSAYKEPSRIVVNNIHLFIHPQWDPEKRKGIDIALIRLSRAIKFNHYIRPICLPKSSDGDHVGDSVTIAGWGKVADRDVKISSVLRKAESTIISTAQCKRSFSDSVGIDQRLHICIKGGSNGVCKGDSGGPMNFKNADGTWTVIGIVSFAPDCLNSVGVFTRVSSYLDWIESVKSQPNRFKSSRI